MSGDSELIEADAFLLVGFGGPEGPDEVMPFLERVTAGRGVPPERLRAVGQHYFDRGGVSPINGWCRSLLAALEPAFEAAGLDLPIYWGNRNAPPFLDDTVARMGDDGVRRALAFVTSAYSSYSGCRQYRENLTAAREAAGPGAPVIDKLRVYFNHPGFIDPMADGVERALGGLAAPVDRAALLFCAHSIPISMAESSMYVSQLESAAGLVAERLSRTVPWSLVWQSRSGPPTVPWLEPDVADAIGDIGATGAAEAVVVVPLGFVSDHMEVIQDLDTDAAAAAADAGLEFARSATPGTDPRFVDMIVELVRERVERVTPVALGELGLVPDQCLETCCPPPRRP